MTCLSASQADAWGSAVNIPLKYLGFPEWRILQAVMGMWAIHQPSCQKVESTEMGSPFLPAPSPKCRRSQVGLTET